MAKLKNKLVERIKMSQDTEFLKAIEQLLQTSENSVYKLTTEQEQAIALGRKEIANGDFLSNQTVIEEVREWLRNP